MNKNLQSKIAFLGLIVGIFMLGGARIAFADPVNCSEYVFSQTFNATGDGGDVIIDRTCDTTDGGQCYDIWVEHYANGQWVSNYIILNGCN